MAEWFGTASRLLLTGSLLGWSLGVAAQSPMLIGGDISALTLLEQHGAQYSDRSGHPGDAVQILRQSGANIVRLRLYEHPGPAHGTNGYYWPEYSMDLPDVLALARRAAAAHLQIQLTFHYSDFWTNSSSQDVPLDWAAELQRLPDDASRFARLRELLYEHTRQAMLAMQAQGTTPQFVSIGNEIEKGMLYPYGAANEANWPRLAALLRAGYDAVKSVAPGAQVVIHLDDAGNLPKYRDYFNHAQQLGVKWDVIGTSYYPFWSHRSVAQAMAFCQTVAGLYDKDVLIMETGFNWNPTLPDGAHGQLSDNGPYPDSMSSPAGQRDFMRELMEGIRHTPRVLGFLYWDPVMIAVPGVGWGVSERDASAGQNVVSNTTLFDFHGQALPVLDVWREFAERDAADKSTTGLNRQ